MDKYYYFVSQLPYLKFESEPPFTREEFLEEALKWMTPGDFSALAGANSNKMVFAESRQQVLNEYKDFEYNFRQIIFNYREAVKNDTEVRVSETFWTILTEGNPLEVEKKLSCLKWGFIESLEVSHHFDAAAIILYFLKLQILERLASFNKVKGRKIFDKLCEISLATEEKSVQGKI